MGLYSQFFGAITIKTSPLICLAFKWQIQPDYFFSLSIFSYFYLQKTKCIKTIRYNNEYKMICCLFATWGSFNKRPFSSSISVQQTTLLYFCRFASFKTRYRTMPRYKRTWSLNCEFCAFYEL